MTKQSEFLISEFWILSWNASVQRAQLYRHGTSDIHRTAFRNDVIGFCQNEFIPQYTSEVAEDRHVRNLTRLCEMADSSPYANVLKHGYRIGVAQKLLNLQLKYMWCADLLPHPPHCPIDRVILSKTRLKGTLNWTQMNSTAQYLQAIAALREIAGEMPLAEWELDVFERRSRS